MASFRIAVEKILSVEGGYSNDPRDPGGETRFGISRRAYPDLNIAELTREAAIQIYRADYWDYDWVDSQEVAEKLFDMAVNMGVQASNRYLQHALRALGFDLKVDGVVGLKTASATHSANPTVLLAELRRWQIKHYLSVSNVTHPFLKGWLLQRVAP
jgi:lysozyme family protein